MKRFIFVVPTMILVFSIAVWMLDKDYAMINSETRLLIATGASVFSGVLTFFLMKGDAEQLAEAHKERKQNKLK